jgi:hypothetical protein
MAEVPMQPAIALVAFVGKANAWQAALKDKVYGDILFVGEGETAFGYLVKQLVVERDRVILNRAGKDIELRMGEHADANESLDLITLPQWIREWRERVASSPPAAQQVAREQMREYWKEQWVSGLGEAVSRLRPQEQLMIRAEISRYWRE